MCISDFSFFIFHFGHCSIWIVVKDIRITNYSRSLGVLRKGAFQKCTHFWFEIVTRRKQLTQSICTLPVIKEFNALVQLHNFPTETYVNSDKKYTELSHLSIAPMNSLIKFLSNQSVGMKCEKSGNVVAKSKMHVQRVQSCTGWKMSDFNLFHCADISSSHMPILGDSLCRFQLFWKLACAHLHTWIPCTCWHQFWNTCERNAIS